MQHITGIPRNQMCFSSLEDTISPENPIRFVEAFVEAIAKKSFDVRGSCIMNLRADKKLFPTFSTSRWNGILYT